jgi:hypothetical protein
MQARQTPAPGQRGAIKFLDRYGEQSACNRNRHDQQWRKGFTSLEVIVEASVWSPPEKLEIVGLRVEFPETELQRRIELAGRKGYRRSKSGRFIMTSR